MHDYKDFTDNELIDLLQDSDHAAYTEIYNRYHYLMLVHAYKKLREEDRAKDMVADLFTNLWLKREQIPTTRNLAGYLYVSLRNSILDYYAHQNVESKYIASLKVYLSTIETTSTDHLVREKELQAYIDQEIEALPKRMRKAFELSKKDNLSNTEIASLLNTTESNVSQHVNNAIRILRAKLSAIFSILF